MKIRVDFTIEIHPDSIEFLKELSGLEGPSALELRGYVRGEAEDSLCQYLEMSGVHLRRVRSVYGEGEYA